MKLLIPFLSILSLGNAVNQHHPLRLSDAQREKIQKRMLEHANACYSDMDASSFSKLIRFYEDDNNSICTDATDGNPSCTLNYGNATLVDQFADICVNDLDGRVETANIIGACRNIYRDYKENLDGDLYETPDGVFYNQYDYTFPVCVPNTCTGEEAPIEFINLIYNFEQIQIEDK